MQAHDQTCEERKKEDGDDTAAPFTRDPGTYEGCLAGPTSEKAREAAVAAMRAETQAAKHVEERVRRRCRSIETACGCVPTCTYGTPANLHGVVATEDTSEKCQGQEYPRDKWSGKASCQCYLPEVREVGSPHGQRVHGNRWTTSGSHTRRQRPRSRNGSKRWQRCQWRRKRRHLCGQRDSDRRDAVQRGRTDRVALQLRLRRSQSSA